MDGLRGCGARDLFFQLLFLSCVGHCIWPYPFSNLRPPFSPRPNRNKNILSSYIQYSIGSMGVGWYVPWQRSYWLNVWKRMDFDDLALELFIICKTAKTKRRA